MPFLFCVTCKTLCRPSLSKYDLSCRYENMHMMVIRLLEMSYFYFYFVN